MASRTLWLCVTSLRDKIADYGHAMPINSGKLGCNGGIIMLDSPAVFVLAQGCSVPISRGSPPTSQ